MQTQKVAIIVLVAFFVFILVLAAHNAAYSDAQREHEMNCQMVKDGLWPASSEYAVNCEPSK